VLLRPFISGNILEYGCVDSRPPKPAITIVPLIDLLNLLLEALEQLELIAFGEVGSCFRLCL